MFKLIPKDLLLKSRLPQHYLLRYGPLGILLSSILCAPHAKADTLITTLKDLRWDHRIILLQTDDTSGKQAQAWRTQLQANDADIRERHILWFLFSPTQIAGNNRSAYKPTHNIPSRLNNHKLSNTFASDTLKKHFADSKGNKVILIGKDGHVKETEAKLNLDYLFSAIDVMPMRQAEMGSVE